MYLPFGRVQFEFVLQMRALVVLSLLSFVPARACPRAGGSGAMHAAPSVECSWPHKHSVRSAHSMNKWTLGYLCVCATEVFIYFPAAGQLRRGNRL